MRRLHSRRGRRCATTSATPDVSPIVARYHGDRPWALPDRPGDLLDAGDRRRRDRLRRIGRHLLLRDRPERDAPLAAEDRRHHRRRRRAVSVRPAIGSAPLTFGSGDERLYHVTTPRTGAPADPLDVPSDGAAGQGSAGRLVGGQRRDRSGRQPVRRQHGRHGVRDLARPVTGCGRSRPATRSGRRLPSRPTARASGARSTSTSTGSTRTGARSGTRSRPATSSPRRRSDPTGPSTSARSTPSCTRSIPPPGPRAGRSRRATTSTRSPALGQDATGHTSAIYVGSTDGSVYALSPRGQLRWRYDTGEPIRSSPVLGAAPAGERGEILYVGSSNGKLYALNAPTGRRRWSFDTTPRDPALRDRNDLNASPALGRTGVYIAGEHGYVDYVPYDYCLRRRDSRCSTNPAQEFGDQLDRVFPVSAGGTHAGHRRAPQRLPRDRLQPASRRSPSRTDGQRGDARPGPTRSRLTALPVYHPGVRRRPLPVPGSPRSVAARDHVPAPDRRALHRQRRANGQLQPGRHGRRTVRPDDHAPGPPGRRPPGYPCAHGATGSAQSRSAAWPCRCPPSCRRSTRSVSTATTGSPRRSRARARTY